MATEHMKMSAAQGGSVMAMEHHRLVLKAVQTVPCSDHLKAFLEHDSLFKMLGCMVPYACHQAHDTRYMWCNVPDNMYQGATHQVHWCLNRCRPEQLSNVSGHLFAFSEHCSGTVLSEAGRWEGAVYYAGGRYKVRAGDEHHSDCSELEFSVQCTVFSASEGLLTVSEQMIKLLE